MGAGASLFLDLPTNSTLDLFKLGVYKKTPRGQLVVLQVLQLRLGLRSGPLAAHTRHISAHYCFSITSIVYNNDVTISGKRKKDDRLGIA